MKLLLNGREREIKASHLLDYVNVFDCYFSCNRLFIENCMNRAFILKTW